MTFGPVSDIENLSTGGVIYGKYKVFISILSLNISIFILFLLYELLDSTGAIAGGLDSTVLYLTVIYSLTIIFLSGLLHGGLLNSVIAGFIVLFAEIVLLAGSYVFEYTVVDRFTASLPTLSMLFFAIAIGGYTLGRIGRAGLLKFSERLDIVRDR